MKVANTDTINMNYVDWKIASFNFPFLEVEPPSPFYSYCSPSQKFIDNETHEALLKESLNLYDEIWTTLAQM